MILFKKSTVVVDAFCPQSQSHAYLKAPIDHANKFMPSWWKDLPNPTQFDFDNMKVNGNMKYCSGMIDVYKTGFIMPMWSDLALKVRGDVCHYKYSDEVSEMEFHHQTQRGTFYQNYINIKILSPWKLITKQDIKFYVTSPFWNTDPIKNLTVCSGILLFNERNQFATHIQALIEQKDQDLMIHHGQPIVHFIPLTEKRVEIKRHLVDDKEYESFLNRSFFKFFGKHTKKGVYHGCPFHSKK